MTRRILYRINQVACYQQRKYILSGYLAHQNTHQCFTSLFYMSNELMNIWTHLVPLLYILVLAITDNVSLIPSIGGSLTDNLVFTLYYFGALTCLSTSVVFHSFSCHMNQKVHCNCLFADLNGIYTSMISSTALLLYYMLNEYLFFYKLAISTAFVLYLMTVTVFRKTITKSSIVRNTVFSIITLACLLPVVCWLFIAGNNEFYLVVPFMARNFLWFVFAALLYVYRFPENILPGKFDYIGSSHNFWHAIVAFNIYKWRELGLLLLIENKKI